MFWIKALLTYLLTYFIRLSSAKQNVGHWTMQYLLCLVFFLHFFVFFTMGYDAPFKIKTFCIFMLRMCRSSVDWKKVFLVFSFSPPSFPPPPKKIVMGFQSDLFRDTESKFEIIRYRYMYHEYMFFSVKILQNRCHRPVGDGYVYIPALPAGSYQ